MTKDTKGLYNKYIIQKANGKPVDKNARYIVLRYDEDTDYCLAARTTLLLFARLIKHFALNFYKDLTRQMENAEIEIYYQKLTKKKGLK